MKINKHLLLLFSCGILLAGCGEKELVNTKDDIPEDTTESTTSESVNEKSTSEIEESDENIVDDDFDSNVSESELGKMTRLATNKDLNETQQNGPFKVTVEAIKKGQMQPTEDYIEILGGEDLAIIAIKLLVEHDSEDTDTIHPDQGTIVTNTRKQVGTDMFLSDSVGGDFIGPVDKSGEILFIFDDNAEDITSFKYIVDSGHDENYDHFGDDLTFEFEF